MSGRSMTILCWRCTRPALPTTPDDCSEHPICGHFQCRKDHEWCRALTIAQKTSLWQTGVRGWQ